MPKKIAHGGARPGRASGPALLLLCLLLPAAVAGAADQLVDFDHQIDFSAVHTFSMRGTVIHSDRPEIHSTLVAEEVTASIRAALTARGLREIPQDADVSVDWSAGGQRFTINEWGHAIALDEEPGGMPVPRGNPWRNNPESFVEGLLVVDLTAKSGLLVWRGVYRNREHDSARLAHQLSGYAQHLLAAYPPRRK